MGNFSYGGRQRDGRDSRRPQMHDAICDECKRDCRVPFRPSGDKPIYCSDCFERKGGRDSNRSSRGGYNRRDSDNRGSGRHQQGNSDNRGNQRLVEGIDSLNAKLDTIIGLLSPVEEKKMPSVAKKAKKVKKIKKTKKSKKAKSKK